VSKVFENYPQVNVLLVGVILVLFVVAAPNGIVGLFQAWRRRREA
jgi:ABC-type branched-subunit amino acid transport system permease subunit